MGHEDKVSREAQKKKDDEDEAQMRKEMRETWAKNWEESRQGRVDSWMTFKGKTPYGQQKAEKVKKAKEEMNGKEVEGKAVEIFFAEKREPRPKREKKWKAEKTEDKKEQTTPEKKSKRKRRRKGKGNKNKEEASDDKKTEKPEENKQETKPKGRRRVFLKCLVEA